MTGLPTILVRLDDGSGTFPYDISQYVRLADAEISIGRGRRNESDVVEASRLTLRLDNDGRFTLGNPTYGVYVDQPIRVTLGGIHRFTGYVDDWPVEFPSPSGNYSIVKVDAYDLLPQLTRTRLHTMLEDQNLVDRPVAYYPLNETDGAVAGGDVSGRGQEPLAQAGTGTPIGFGAGTGPVTTEQPAATFPGGRRYLRAQLAGAGNANHLYVEFWFRRYGNPAQREQLFELRDVSGSDRLLDAFLEVDGKIVAHGFSAGMVSVESYADGELHHVSAWYDTNTGTIRLWVDGIQDNALAGVGVTSLQPGHLTVGGQYTGTEILADAFTGTLAHVVIYNGTSAIANRIPDRAAAGNGTLDTDRSDQRIARLAGYIGITGSQLSLQTGVLTRVAVDQTAGVDVITALRAVERAEGGLLFINGAGRLVMQNRQHRALTATAAPAAVLTDVEHEDLVVGGSKEYLVNEAEGSRLGGTTQRVVDQPSYDLRRSYPANETGLLVTTDAEVADRLSWLVETHADPKPRLASVTLDVLTSPELLAGQILFLELGSRITVEDLPGLSPIVDADLIVEGWTERISIDTWTVTFNTAPAELHHAWVLGDPTHGVLGATTRLHY